jgi:hypothetical protein
MCVLMDFWFFLWGLHCLAIAATQVSVWPWVSFLALISAVVQSLWWSTMGWVTRVQVQVGENVFPWLLIQTSSGFHPASIQWILEALSMAIKQPGCEAESSPLSSAKCSYNRFLPFLIFLIFQRGLLVLLNHDFLGRWYSQSLDLPFIYFLKIWGITIVARKIITSQTILAAIYINGLCSLYRYITMFSSTFLNWHISFWIMQEMMPYYNGHFSWEIYYLSERQQ